MPDYMAAAMISVILRILGIIMLFVAFALALLGVQEVTQVQQTYGDPNMAFGVTKLIAAATIAFSGLLNLALGQGIQMLIDIARNSWTSATATQQTSDFLAKIAGAKA